MTPRLRLDTDQFRRAEVLFETAAALPHEERAAYLDAECPDDTGVRHKVEALLKQDERRQSLLDLELSDLGIDIDADALQAPPLPSRIGPYRIISVLGQGGMGVVYRARQSTPERDVALKVLRPGLAPSKLIGRFRREAMVLGRLSHPGIARIFDAGVADGPAGPQPYLAMELVEGRSILEHAERGKLDLRARIELLIEVCDAVHHAHQRGIIHCDLKPGNIVVAERDGRARPVVLDFGIARPIAPEARVTTEHAEVGQLIGTLAFMSPEQVRADGQDIDTCSDVYALGVVAYELLAGMLPIDVKGRPLPEAIRLIAEGTRHPLGMHAPALRGDLETIVHKAMALEKRERYQSASELADELRRYLADEPIVARPASAMYQLGKFARRNRTLVSAAGLVTMLLVASAIVSTTMYMRAEARAERLRRASYAQNISLARSAYDDQDMAAMTRFLDACPQDLRGWEWHRLTSLSDNSALRLAGHPSPVASVAWSPDGTRLVTGGGYEDTTPGDRRACDARIWDARDGRLLHVLDDDCGPVNAIAVSPDGKRVATAGGTHWSFGEPSDPWVRIWDLETGRLLQRLEGDEQTTWSMAFLDDDTLVVGGETLQLAVFDLRTGARRIVARGMASVISVAVDRAARRVYTVGWGRIARCFDLETDACIWSAHVGLPGFAVALNSRADTLAVGGLERAVRLLDTATGAVRSTFPVANDTFDLAFTADDEAVIVSGTRETVRIVELATAQDRAVLRGALGRVPEVALAPDGRRIAGTSPDGVVRLWPVDLQDHIVVRTGQREINEARWLPAGGVFFAGDDPIAGTWMPADTAVRALEPSHTVAVLVADVSRDGRIAVTADSDGRMIAWDLQRAAQLATWNGHAGVMQDVAVAPDGRTAVSSAFDGTVRLWSLEPDRCGEELRTHGDGERFSYALAYADDSATYFVADNDGRVSVWDTETGRLLRDDSVSDTPVRALGIRAELLAISCGAGEVQLWDWRRWRHIRTIETHATRCRSVSFSHDGTRLLTAGDDGRIKIFAIDTGGHLFTIRAHERQAYSARFCDDDEHILTCGADGAVRIWPMNVAEAMETPSEPTS